MEQFEFGLKDKQYWEKLYNVELNNFHDHGDVGEVWFDHAVGELHQWILDNVEMKIQDQQNQQVSVLDIGSGNGVFLFDLATALNADDCDFAVGRLVGVDYVQEAVDLSNEVLHSSEQYEDFVENLTFLCGDALELERIVPEGSTFDLIHDKGTYDVISLRGQEEIDRYIQQVTLVSHSDTVMCITSCNHTSEELEKTFTSSKQWRTLKVRRYPTFKFGGASGAQVATVVFQRA
jgi:SAM-dependent methyltransferase